MSVASLQDRPMNDIPTGSPNEYPTGTVMLGERDQVGERLHGARRPEPREVRVQVRFELVQEDRELLVAVVLEVRDLDGIDQHGALRLEHLEGGVDEPVAFRVTEGAPCH